VATVEAHLGNPNFGWRVDDQGRRQAPGEWGGIGRAHRDAALAQRRDRIVSGRNRVAIPALT
jgi:hypothetical protein